MSTIAQSIERHHKPIIALLVGLIAFFLISCTFNGAIPICHYVFGCDHGFHTAAN